MIVARSEYCILYGCGIILSLGVYGILQERIMSRPYGDAEYFKYSLLLVLFNRLAAVLLSLCSPIWNATITMMFGDWETGSKTAGSKTATKQLSFKAGDSSKEKGEKVLLDATVTGDKMTRQKMIKLSVKASLSEVSPYKIGMDSLDYPIDTARTISPSTQQGTQQRITSPNELSLNPNGKSNSPNGMQCNKPNGKSPIRLAADNRHDVFGEEKRKVEVEMQDMKGATNGTNARNGDSARGRTNYTGQRIFSSISRLKSDIRQNMTSLLFQEAPLWKYACVSVGNVTATYCQYEALRYVSFPVQMLTKSFKMFPVMLMSILLSGKRYTYRDWLISLIVTLGVTTFLLTGEIEASNSISNSASTGTVSVSSGRTGSSGGSNRGGRQLGSSLTTIEVGEATNRHDESGDSSSFVSGTASSLSSSSGSSSSIAPSLFYGLSLLLLFLVADGFTSTFQEKLFKTHKTVTKAQQILFTNLSSSILSFSVLVCSNQLLDGFAFMYRHPSCFSDACVLSISALIGQFFIVSQLKEFGALVLAATMNIRQMASIILSYVVFDEIVANENHQGHSHNNGVSEGGLFILHDEREGLKSTSLANTNQNTSGQGHHPGHHPSVEHAQKSHSVQQSHSKSITIPQIVALCIVFLALFGGKPNSPLGRMSKEELVLFVASISWFIISIIYRLREFNDVEVWYWQWVT